MNDISLCLSLYVPITEVEGPGKRFAIWLSSDPSHSYPLSDIFLHIKSVSDIIEGVTFLGCEPLHQSLELAELARLIKTIGLSIMFYSTYSLRELRSRAVDNKGLRLFLTHADLLVSGPYLPQLSDQSKPWRGSTNQDLHFLGDDADSQSMVPSLKIPQKRYLECRIQRSPTNSLTCLIHGHSYEKQVKTHSLNLGISIKMSHLLGQQWLEDLFVRDSPTVEPNAQWLMDHTYWTLALDKSRKHCLKWLIAQSGSQLLPLLFENRIIDQHPLDQDLRYLPLSFKEYSEAILAGPRQWATSLKNKQMTNISRSFSYDFSQISIGDWSLISILAPKMLRTNNLRWLCVEMADLPLKKRSMIEDWFIRGSPFYGLLRPQKSVQYFTQITVNDWHPQAQAALTLIIPSLLTHWLNPSHIEQVKDHFFSSNTWAHLEAIYALNEWAVTLDFHLLGEACLKTFDRLLANTEPADFFQVNETDMETVMEERRFRLKLVSAPLLWRPTIERARECVYGQAGEREAQLTLRYARRWNTLTQRLHLFERYGQSLVSESTQQMNPGPSNFSSES